MANNKSDYEPVPPTPMEVVQTTPKGKTRSYDEMNTGMMVFELQGTVGELKEAINILGRTVEKQAEKVQSAERASAEVRDMLRQLSPKIEEVASFIKHRGPSLAEKNDVTSLRSEIERRPTRRQAVTDIVWIVGIICTALTIGAKFAH